MTQLTFDFDALIEPETSTYEGPAPLGFTTDYFTPEQLDAADVEVVRLRGGTAPLARVGARRTWRMWSFEARANMRTAGHEFWMLHADLRCMCRLPFLAVEWEKFWGCECVGSLLFQANCPPCRWHAIGRENEVVEAWHDHAWPGWRDLPIVPLRMAPGPFDAAKGKWSREALAVFGTFPEEFRRDGAPVLTQRSQWGTRHVPGRSPWGGFDLSSTAVGGELRVW